MHYSSDPNRERSVDEAYYLEKPGPVVRREVAVRLQVPLQVWHLLLKTPAGARRSSSRSVCLEEPGQQVQMRLLLYSCMPYVEISERVGVSERKSACIGS